VDEYRLRLLVSLFYEFINLAGDFVALRIEQDLVLTIVPIEGEVDHANILPQVGELPARTIDNPGDLICKYKF